MLIYFIIQCNKLFWVFLGGGWGWGGVLGREVYPFQASWKFPSQELSRVICFFTGQTCSKIFAYYFYYTTYTEKC